TKVVGSRPFPALPAHLHLDLALVRLGADLQFQLDLPGRHEPERALARLEGHLTTFEPGRERRQVFGDLLRRSDQPELEAILGHGGSYSLTSGRARTPWPRHSSTASRLVAVALGLAPGDGDLDLGLPFLLARLDPEGEISVRIDGDPLVAHGQGEAAG